MLEPPSYRELNGLRQEIMRFVEATTGNPPSLDLIDLMESCFSKDALADLAFRILEFYRSLSRYAVVESDAMYVVQPDEAELRMLGLSCDVLSELEPPLGGPQLKNPEPFLIAMGRLEQEVGEQPHGVRLVSEFGPDAELVRSWMSELSKKLITTQGVALPTKKELSATLRAQLIDDLVVAGHERESLVNSTLSNEQFAAELTKLRSIAELIRNGVSHDDYCELGPEELAAFCLEVERNRQQLIDNFLKILGPKTHVTRESLAGSCIPTLQRKITLATNARLDPVSRQARYVRITDTLARSRVFADTDVDARELADVS